MENPGFMIPAHVPGPFDVIPLESKAVKLLSLFYRLSWLKTQA